MSALIELRRKVVPWEIAAGPGDLIAVNACIEGRPFRWRARVLDNQDHGWMIFLDCENCRTGHVHKLQLPRDGPSGDEGVLSIKILEPVSLPSWVPVEPRKDPVDVPG